jgi:hypothetical protein
MSSLTVIATATGFCRVAVHADADESPSTATLTADAPSTAVT